VIQFCGAVLQDNGSPIAGAGESTMTITLTLSPEIQAKVQRTAEIAGLPVQDVIQQALEQLPAPAAPEENELTLWDRVQAVLQPSWEAQPKGAKTHFAEMEAACGVPEEKQA